MNVSVDISCVNRSLVSNWLTSLSNVVQTLFCNFIVHKLVEQSFFFTNSLKRSSAAIVMVNLSMTLIRFGWYGERGGITLPKIDWIQSTKEESKPQHYISLPLSESKLDVMFAEHLFIKEAKAFSSEIKTSFSLCISLLEFRSLLLKNDWIIFQNFCYPSHP